jgi:hypothetical protein
MSPIPEFTDALSESTKSCDTSASKVTEKKDTETDRRQFESESEENLEPHTQSSDDTSRSAVAGDVDVVQTGNENESSISAGSPQNEKPSEMNGSPVEEHWLEVSVPKYNFVCYQCNSA